MSPRWMPDDVDEVRARADIVEVVGEHVRLRRAGRQFKGLCPLHQEKTPSFTVNPDRGVWYCHGCHAGGNVFRFLMDVDGLSFPEAVETLATRYGVELRETAGQPRRESAKAKLTALHETAVDLYRRMLESRAGAAVREYLEERGISTDVRERYRLGFGGWDRNGLVRSLVRSGTQSEDLVAAGLASRDGRSVKDTFHGRVLFPIFDAADRPVGFGGRVLPERFRREGTPDGPKYLNSRESPLFRKSRVLYGANWSRADVMRCKRLVVVEGYTDVIAMREAGIGETVATCGTSLTEQHMQEVSRRFGDVRVVLCLDADAAGQAAMAGQRTEELAAAYSPGEKVGDGWLPVGRGWLPEVHVARLPQGLDPAEFAAAEGGDAVRAVLDDAAPLVEFLLRRALAAEPARTPEGRARAVRRGADVLAQVGDSLLRHEYVLWLADRAGVDAHEVGRAVDARVASASSGAPPAARLVDAPEALTGHQRVEREVFRAIFAVPRVILAGGDAELDEDDFTLPLHRALYRLVRAEWDETGGVDAARLGDRVQDDAMRRAVSESSVGDPPDDSAGREMLLRLKVFSLERQIEVDKQRLRQLDAERDGSGYDGLFEHLLVKQKQVVALKDRLRRLDGVGYDQAQ